jgi:8-oxo-dGTP diphosphatase
MDKIVTLLTSVPLLMIGVSIALVLLVVIGIVIIVSAYRDGREVSIAGLKIGKKDSPQKREEEGNRIRPIGAVSASVEYCAKRKQIHWEPYNDKATHRFWACGTSLIGVSERGMLQKYFAKGLQDIKIILPSVSESHSSFQQLELYDRQQDSRLIYNQVQAARESYRRLVPIIEKATSRPAIEIIRKYTGIMYSNITIFDDDAFISFYDSTGVGENNITLHHNRSTNMDDYRSIEEEFLRMWNAPPELMTVRKRRGASILFINHEDRVLLFLRDNKVGIPFPNMWDVLGGNVENGESPLQCIVREMNEEIEYRLDKPALFDVRDMDDRIEFTYWKREEFDLNKVILHEGQKLKWFSEVDIKSLGDSDIAFGFKRIILDFFNTKPYLHS